MKKNNKILSIILTVLCVVSIVVPVGFVLYFNYVFSKDIEQPENYNPAQSFNSKYNINISDDAEVLYCKSNAFGWFGDGITYCVFNLVNENIGVTWNDDKKNVFEEEVDSLTGYLAKDLQSEEQSFVLENTFDWSKDYKWYCKYKLFSTNEYVDTINEEIDRYSDGFFAFFVPEENRLYCVEINI